VIVYSASQAGKHFGEIRERALVEPVGIDRRGKLSVVVISASEYERLKALDSRRPLSAEEIPPELIDELDAKSMHAGHAHLDALMDDADSPEGSTEG